MNYIRLKILRNLDKILGCQGKKRLFHGVTKSKQSVDFFYQNLYHPYKSLSIWITDIRIA